MSTDFSGLRRLLGVAVAGVSMLSVSVAMAGEITVWCWAPEFNGAAMQAAADAYLNLFKDKSVQVPWGTPCTRLEGSAFTGRGLPTDSCNVGVPDNIDMADRRYIIDPVVGAVAVFLKMGPNKRPDAHVFRIEDGKIVKIHTITSCGTDVNCGFDPLDKIIAARPDFYPNLDNVPVVTRPQR